MIRFYWQSKDFGSIYCKNIKIDIMRCRQTFLAIRMFRECYKQRMVFCDFFKFRLALLNHGYRILRLKSFSLENVLKFTHFTDQNRR